LIKSLYVSETLQDKNLATYGDNAVDHESTMTAYNHPCL